MGAMGSSDKESMVRRLTEKKELLGRFFDLCREQAGFLAEGKLDELNASFDKGMKFREKINGLHQELEPLVQSYASSEKNKDAGIEELLGEVLKKTEACAKLNEENMILTQEMILEQKKKIDEQRSKREGITGYAQAVTGASEVFDRKT